jgi:hypothetical protein
MKKILLVSVALALLVGSADAQYRVHSLFSSESYSNTSADTSDTIVLDPFESLSLFFSFADSNNVNIDVDYRHGSGAWVEYVASDSTNNVTAAGSSIGKLIRRLTTDNIPGAAEFRVRVTGMGAASGKNGTTSATFNGWAFIRQE